MSRQETLRRAFPGELREAWERSRRRLEQAGYGEAVARAYAERSPALALAASPELAVALAGTVSRLAIRAGRRAAALAPDAALIAAGRLKDDQALARWLVLVEDFGRAAPESATALLERTGLLLDALGLDGLEAWMRAGLGAARRDPARRLAFFTLEDAEARHWLDRQAGSAGFVDLEARLKPYLTALWGIRPPVREAPAQAPEHLKRRAGFGGGVIRVPAAFPGFSADDTKRLYQAALAHIGAHRRFTREPFRISGLKPIQVALVSLVEDARAERLAMRKLPGLAALWRPFHVARPVGTRIAPTLLARLSRALIDSRYEDDDGWVAKGRDLFEAAAGEMDDQQISRRIGGLLGNDLGQMRVQFDAKTYVVQPAYRDDNLGIWDFGDDDSPPMAEMEAVIDTARLIAEERDTDRLDRQEPEEGAEAETGRALVEERSEGAMLVARYPEYDYVTGRERPEWCALNEYPPVAGRAEAILNLRDERADLVNRLTALIRSSRISRHQRIRRQAEGEFLDIDACIDAVVARRAGETPDPRVHGRYERRSRDLSVLVLLDVSRSTADRVRGSVRSVLDMERQAAALLAHAMTELGDPFALHAFSSDTRDDVRYLRVKDFDRPCDAHAFARLAGLESGFSTRLGAAIRHAGAELAGRQSHRRLLLVVTDGEPSDVDVDDRRYLVEDARAAVNSLARKGVDVFCVALDSQAESYVGRIFGRRNAVNIDTIERLPERLPMLYLRLTA